MVADASSPTPAVPAPNSGVFDDRGTHGGADGEGTVGQLGEREIVHTPSESSSTPDEGAGMRREIGGTRRRRTRRWVLEWLAVVLVAVAVAAVVRVFVVQTFYIPSGSMEPTLMIGDRILVDKLSYHLHGVGRGDIVVFSRPPGEPASPGLNDLVKRVIGLPGEWISSEPDGTVLINNKPLSEPWLGTLALSDPGPPIRRQLIPAGEYFVMGDNRGNSQDSRYFGPISRSLIVGRVVFRIWPISHMSLF
jgi:signal peptidase I